MLLIFYCTLLMVTAFVRCSDNRMYREDESQDGKEPKIEESFDSPVYSPSNLFSSGVANGKSAYNQPALVSYNDYIASLGYAIPYAYSPYSGYGTIPYPVPSAYGAMLNNPAYVSAFMPGLGYTGYGGPYSERSVYSNFGYGYPNYNSGLSYPLSDIRRAVPIVNPLTPLQGIPRPAQLAAVPSSVPAVPSVPAVSSVAAAPFPPLSGVAASVPRTLSYRTWAPTGVSKGGQIPNLG